MTLNKKRMVREIGRRTRLKNRDVQTVIETLMDVWTESLVEGERIELENFIVLETQTIDRSTMHPLSNGGHMPRFVRQIRMRVSATLKRRVNLSSKAVGLTLTHGVEDAS